MNSENIQLFIGLGNPGEKYSMTRHNIGFMVLEKLANEENCAFSKNKKIQGYLTERQISGKKVRILLPSTFMNDSGKSILAALNWFDLRIDQMIILVDDMDLPLGKIRMRSKGSSGGHNGLKSIINNIGTQDFLRIRIGIGPPSQDNEERKSKTISHVLGTFNKQEIEIVNAVVIEVIKGLKMIQTEGIKQASNYLNSYKEEAM